MRKRLTITRLRNAAKEFSIQESTHKESSIFGTTDGKRIGTYLEHKFKEYLANDYDFTYGNSASGIDFPELKIDMKVTSVKQPQSSCPFKSARQKLYGLGYHLLIFVYDKHDYIEEEMSNLEILHTIFIDKDSTGDWQTTSGIIALLENEANTDDIMAFFEDRRLPVDDITSKNLAEEVINNPPNLGYLTISNALQWRLQYQRVINEAGKIDGIWRIR